MFGYKNTRQELNAGCFLSLLLLNFTIFRRKVLIYLHRFKNTQELALVSLPNTEGGIDWRF